MKGDVITVVGIDPGLKGAIVSGRLIEAALPCGRDKWVEMTGIYKMPVTDDIDGKNLPDPRALSDLLRNLDPACIILEHVNYRADLMIKSFDATAGRGKRPRNFATEWRFAQGFGTTLSACQLTFPDRRTHLASPSAWKAAMGLTNKGKDGALDAGWALERKIRPEGAKFAVGQDDNKAEALLLIEYYRQHLSHLPTMVAF